MKTMRKNDIQESASWLPSRRSVLRGAGAGLSATLTQAMFGGLVRQARGAAPRKRLMLFTNGNGFLESQWKHQVRSPSDFDLRPVFAPLAPFKKDLLILEQFYNPFDRALHGNQWATLSVRPSKSTEANEYRETPGGISLDRYLAQKIGASDPFSSIALGLREGGNGPVLCVSADGADMKFPAIPSPVKAFETIFGGKTPLKADPRGTFASRKRLLDFVRADTGKMNALLPGPERVKLDQYLTSLGQVEDQIRTLQAHDAQCATPMAPAASLDRTNLDPNVVRAQVDVAFNALLCGMTRIAHMSILGFEGPHDRYEWLGDTRGHHDQHHDGNIEMITKIDLFVLGEIAHMVKRLKETPEGNGNMLDNTLVMYVNTVGGGHHDGQDNHMVLLIGSCGGELKTGRYLAYAKDKHCISDVFASVATAMGVPTATFGEPSICKGPLPGLTMS